MMSIKRKMLTSGERVKRSRADFFRCMQGTMRHGQETVTQAVSQASTDLKSAVQQARETVLDAEQALAAGTKNFQQAVESCDAASKNASAAALHSIASGEAGVTSAILTILDGLKQVAEGVSDAGQSGQ
jgi:hypothetical protein